MRPSWWRKPPASTTLFEAEGALSSKLSIDLVVTSGKEIGRRYTLRVGQTFLLGRSRKVAIRLDDALASRQHASAELSPRGLFITDLGSRNGTFVDGVRLESHAPFDASDAGQVQIGEHILRFDLEDDDNEKTLAWKNTAPRLPDEEFEVLGLIGQGASGEVYSALHKLLHRQVAIKVLVPDVGSDPHRRERFMREGWVSSQIDSPHVVHVYDVRLVKGQVCMIMELVQGPSALDRLRDGPLPVAEALRIAEDVAHALQAAEDARIVHRDIKPSNILLEPSGVAKLSDFGLAKAIEESGPDLTPAGGVGTLAYVAPEQALDARSADARSDLYALGATLYHLLTGNPPFDPQTLAELRNTFDSDPQPVESLASVPRQLSDLVHALLDKDPEKRPYPANDVARRLRELRLAFWPDTPVVWETQSTPRPDLEKHRTP